MKRLLPLLLIALFPFFTGFSPVHHIDGNPKPHAWLPPDFEPKTGVLLIQRVTWPKRQQRKIEEFMKEKYPYSYEFIDATDINGNPKYADKSIYHFVLVYNYDTHIMTSANNLPVTMFDFSFLDRQGDKKYLPSG